MVPDRRDRSDSRVTKGASLGSMSERPLCVVTRALPLDWIAALSQRCELVCGPAERPGWTEETLAALPRAHAILSLLTERVDAAILARAPGLRVVSNMAVGVDNIDVAACTSRGIPVGHTPGVLTEATADLAFALLLAAARRVPESMADARGGGWTTWSPTGWLGLDLDGATLGIVGMGKIGLAVARRAAGFGLRIVYASRRPVDAAPAGARRVELAELLGASDFVSLHVPLTAETERMIDASALALMKPTAILVNTSRGGIVDQAALVAALAAGRIAGAALDVSEPEPLPTVHPLWGMKNVVLTPHIGSATTGTRRRMAELAVMNVLAGVEGRALPHCVNCADLKR
jgi:lactate dehydrogenase-like 2-hydroxyacid dehydrogenase